MLLRSCGGGWDGGPLAPMGATKYGVVSELSCAYALLKRPAREVD
jgi:hypothetical protein